MSNEINYAEIANQANQFLEENNFGNYSVPLLYPSFGYIDVKLLVNPNTPRIMWREITEHEFDTDGKFACMSNFNRPCDFCKLIAERGNLWKDVKKTKRTYYFIYAVLVDYKLEVRPDSTSTFTMPEKGSVVVLKLPKGAFQQIAQLIKNAEMSSKIFKPEGLVIRIENSPDIQYYYRVTPTDVTYNVSDAVSNKQDEMIGLDEFIYGKEPSDSVLEKFAQKTSQFESILDDIVRRMANNGVNPNNGSTRTAPPRSPINQSQPQNSEPQPDENPDFTAKRENPECFGKHNPADSKCFVCTSEMDCIKTTKGAS